MQRYIHAHTHIQAPSTVQGYAFGHRDHNTDTVHVKVLTRHGQTITHQKALIV